VNEFGNLLANPGERIAHVRFVNPAQNVRGAEGNLPVRVTQQLDQGAHRGLPRFAGMAAGNGDAKGVVPFAVDVGEVFELPGRDRNVQLASGLLPRQAGHAAGRHFAEQYGGLGIIGNHRDTRGLKRGSSCGLLFLVYQRPGVHPGW
jgi:hypothetical protein